MAEDRAEPTLDEGEQRRRKVVAWALANENLMEQVRDSIASIERGEKAIPGREVLDEARRRRG